MAERYYNPFQGVEVIVPEEFRNIFTRYCQTGEGKKIIDESPFPRMVDLWFLAACVAARLGLEPAEIGKSKTYKIIEGSIFANEPWRVHTLMLIAISICGNVEIVSEPRRMMAIATSLAVAGLPKVVEMLEEGDAEPIWNLSESLENMIRQR